MTRWISVGFFILALLVLSADCFAGMAVSPLQQWVEVKPGREASFSVTITNTDRGPQTLPCKVKVDVLDFTVSSQGGLSFGKEFKHDRSAVDWISFDADEFVLQPGESRQIEAKVSAPSGADGDYWAVIMVGLDNSKSREKGVNVNLRTASGVFVRVKRRNYIERGSIIDANVVLPEFGPDRNPTCESNGGQTQQALKINAELKNDGLTAFIANGKAFLYTENWRRVASVSLYTGRRRIFPGHTRCFTGVMSQPLPAGKYKLRVFFDPESEYERKITKDMEFSVSDELARQWAENFTGDDMQTVDIKPEEIKLAVTQGRFTAARFLVANQGLSTVSVRCNSEPDELLRSWLELKSPWFTLGPGTRRNVVCSVSVPMDVQPGEYNGTIEVQAECSGLTVQDDSNVETHKIPICIAVSEHGV